MPSLTERVARAIYGGDDARWRRNQKTNGVAVARHQARAAIEAMRPDATANPDDETRAIAVSAKVRGGDAVIVLDHVEAWIDAALKESV